MIVCIGDSIVAGQNLDEWDAPWPAHLNTTQKVIARGIPGDTTRLALERFPRDVQVLVPDICVIQFGHNDANRWKTDRGVPRVSLGSFQENLWEMVDRCEAFGIIPVLCTLTPSQRPAPHPADCLRYDEVLRAVARESFTRLADVSHIADTLDGLHLTPEAHREYAAVVRGVIPW